jgi:hypothetical protein
MLQRIKNYNFKRAVRFFFQRLFRGWDDSETWSLDATFAKMIVPKLRRFKEVSIAVPMGLTEKEWDAILDKMIASFEFHSSELRYDSGNCLDLWNKHQEGLELFAQYFTYLSW